MRNLQAFILVCLTLIALIGVRLVSSHGSMLEPASRNSLWRIDGTAPRNYNDMELFCGGIGVS